MTAACGEGEEFTGNFSPRVEQVASCDLFYPGLLVCHPSRFSEERGLPARNVYSTAELVIQRWYRPNKDAPIMGILP